MFKDTKTGKLLHWCELHKGQNNQWPGMYVNHKSGEHNKWQERKDERKKATKAAKAASRSGTTPTPPTLSLSDKMKSALATKMHLTPQDLDEMMNDPDLK